MTDNWFFHINYKGSISIFSGVYQPWLIKAVGDWKPFSWIIFSQVKNFILLLSANCSRDELGTDRNLQNIPFTGFLFHLVPLVSYKNLQNIFAGIQNKNKVTGHSFMMCVIKLVKI